MHHCIKFVLFWIDILHVSNSLSLHHHEFETLIQQQAYNNNYYYYYYYYYLLQLGCYPVAVVILYVNRT